MIPVLQAVILEERELPGGTTKPLLVTVDNGVGMQKYVVKVFSNRQQEQYSPLAMEVYAHLIARQFDINVPEMALVNFSRTFINTLPNHIKERVNALDTQYHFATKYYDGYLQYIYGTEKKTFEEYDIETIFAFDVLIRNIDRRIAKPNLLVKRQNYLAIDHELCLLITSSFDEYYNRLDWDFIQSKGNIDREHIFLRLLHRNRRNIDFATFSEYLRCSNFNHVIEAAEFLNRLHIPVGEIERIYSYLCSAKTNSQKFNTLLKFLIS